MKLRTQTSGNISCLSPDWSAPPHVHALMSLRCGGVSGVPYESLNLADHVADQQMNVSINRARLVKDLSLPSQPDWLNQTHSTDVIELHDRNRDSVHQADASWTRQPGRICAILTADCLPVVMTNRSGTQIAIAHAGWRGLFDGILDKTLACFDRPGEVLVWIAVGIGPAHFEVGHEMVERWGNDYPDSFFRLKNKPGKHSLNLYQVAKQQLTERGVKEICLDSRVCTYSDSARFFSYRRDGQTGRHATLVWFDGDVSESV